MKMQSATKTIIVSIVLSLFLFACGGGSTPRTVVEGGISGSGLTMGRITNFGSIWVNGVRFNVDNATFLRDGQSAAGQGDFRIGEFIIIKGEVDANGTAGVANHVTFSDILEGSVTAASTDNINIEVLGQPVKTDQLTVLHGISLLTDLQAGNIVEVSGVRNASGLITATSLTLVRTNFNVGESENELKGTVSNLNASSQTFKIGSITVGYSAAVLEGFSAQGVQNGQFVEAKSNADITSNTLIASKVKLEEQYLNLSENTEAEIEGQVTRFVSATDFDVNGIKVTTTSGTKFKGGSAANIALNSLLEVEGTVNASGTIVAEEVSFEDSETASEIEGDIQSINITANEIEVNSRIISINASTLMIDEDDKNGTSLTINDLRVGDRLEIKGSVLNDGRFLATRLERENEDD